MEEQLPQKRNRLSATYAGAYVLAAVFCDVVEIVLTFLVIGIFMNRFITILYNFGVFFFFSIRGIPFWHTKRLANNGIGFLLELTPILDILPAKTATAIINILIVRKEDNAYNHKIVQEHKKNQSVLKKKFLEQQKSRQRSVLVEQRELHRSKRIAELDEKRRQKEIDEENYATIREKQVAEINEPYQSSNSRSSQNSTYQPIRKAA